MLLTIPLLPGGTSTVGWELPPLLRLPLLVLLIVEGAPLTTMGAAAKVTDLPDPGLRGGLGSGEVPRGGVLRTAFSAGISVGSELAFKLDMSGCADRRR